MNHDRMIATLIATRLIASLTALADEDSLSDDVQERTTDVEGAIAMLTDQEAVKRMVVADKRLQKTLKLLVEHMVDAATYMRY